MPVMHREISVFGVVQGVGFRPFIYNLARKMRISGTVENNARGVRICAAAEQQLLEMFAEEIIRQRPPLAVIEDMQIRDLPPENYTDFSILESRAAQSHRVFISPDVSVCGACLAELTCRDDRRFQYPFLNCTHCGPRFTITKDIPYDRKNTVMESFPLCQECLVEYKNPEDRRFHAEPIACPKCGPQIRLLDCFGQNIATEDVLGMARQKILAGKILAIKGLGGYHLACDAKNPEAVQQLRQRKKRDGKPFALMAASMEVIRKYCEVSTEEEALLSGIRRPIVLLAKKSDDLPLAISADNEQLGLMLPYTPLHHLLFQDGVQLCVMTSGNIASEPIYYDDKQAVTGLSGIADYFLVHNREIYIRTDDSVARVFKEKEQVIRRSRGFVPMPIKIPLLAGENVVDMPVILAFGAHLKNTFCLTKNNHAFISHHIGDLENVETLKSFEDGIAHFVKIFAARPDLLVCDLHPDLLSSQYAREYHARFDLRTDILAIQHHHAHVASCMAENGLKNPVIGVAFDGTGYGDDGCIWGGEFFTGNFAGFTRRGHLAYVPMPGGEMAIRHPWRMAVAYLHTTGLLTQESDILKVGNLSSGFELHEISSEHVHTVVHQIQKQLNTPLTSSAGRLFDAVSALCGLCSHIEYEGQAAIRLEKAAQQWMCKHGEMKELPHSLSNQIYPILMEQSFGKPMIIQVSTMIQAVLADMEKGISVEQVAFRFHVSVADMIVKVCRQIRDEDGLNRVVLSGGVFQNLVLLQMTMVGLKSEGFAVFIHHHIPTNDGGISFGQAAIALNRSRPLDR